jgi:mercuric ion binding protein
MHDLNEITVATERAQVVLDPAKASVNALTEATADAGYPSHVKEVQ